MSLDFSDFIDALGGDDFDEKPVLIEEFVTSQKYLGLPPLSDIQYQMIKAATQIYKRQTLIDLYGEQQGLARWSQTFNEVILLLGKGCHAPYTPVFNPETGNWQRLDSLRHDGYAASVSDNESVSCFRTESFQEGYGMMVRVKTSLGFEEDVYVGHKYLTPTGMKEVADLQAGDVLLVGCNFSPKEIVSSEIDIEKIKNGQRIYDAAWLNDNSTLNAAARHFIGVPIAKRLAIDVQRALLRSGTISYIRAVNDGKTINEEQFVVHLVGDTEKQVAEDIIVSISAIGVGEYWTMTVPETGNYIGNGLVSSNSGKDFSSTIACAYVVYLLLCLKNPAKYFGKPDGDAIDIINVAVNAQQARNVFFKGFTNRIRKSPWFAGRFKDKADIVEFDKSITVHSGHSEREAWEGFNLIFCVLDEISAFNLENTSGHQTAKTASDIYKMFRASVDSRFPEFGKVMLLSFPRFKGDYITQKYDDAVLTKNVSIREHTFKIDEELPDGVPENEVTIEWEEDDIVSYKYPKVYAIKRPTWEVNPTISISDLKNAFLADPTDALGRFACMPLDMIDSYFPSRDKIQTAFNNPHLAVDQKGVWNEDIRPQDDKEYFVHVDLAQKHDRCAVAMAHIDSWVNMTFAKDVQAMVAPKVVVDVLRYWIPTAEKHVELSEVRDFILEMKRRGYNIKMVTFDRWNSLDMMNQLAEYGIYTEILSVAKKHYDDFKLAVSEERVHGPYDELLIEELVKLRIIRDKVDHPRNGYKDLSDATCGAIFNAIRRSNRNIGQEIEVHTFASSPKKDNTLEKKTVIRVPRSEMPAELEDYLKSLKML